MSRQFTQEFRGRFYSHVEKTDTCWNWTGYLDQKRGYGRFWTREKKYQAHRVCWEMEVGQIPEGMQLDHLCRNRACVNPAHLEPVTNKENALRGVSFSAANHRKTECNKGHPLTPDNVYLYRNGTSRSCVICAKARAAAFNRAKRLESSNPG